MRGETTPPDPSLSLEEAHERTDPERTAQDRLEAAGVGTWEWRGGRLDTDPGMRRLLGGPATDLDALIARLVPADGDRLRAAWADPGEADLDLEVQVDGPRGPVHLVLRGQVERDAEGRAFRAAGVCFDVTERSQVEGRLASHVRALERSNEDLDRFAWTAAHDLKAPLRDVDNLARWIVEDLQDAVPPDTERHLSLLIRRVGSMQKLLDGLLQHARAGRLEDAVEEVDLAALVRDSAELAALPGTFRLVVEEPMPVLHTPREPLAQVLRNLLSNAVEHHERSDGEITVSAERLGSRVRVTVADDGPGIPRELHERIFVLFTTLEPRDAARRTGVGLAIVKKLVEAYGGRIEVDSRAGGGARFHFTWPAEGLPPEGP